MSFVRAIPPTLVAAAVALAVPAAVNAQQSQTGATDGDGLAAPPGEQPVLREIGAAPEPARLESDLQALVGFHTRHTLSDTVSDTRGVGAARRWVHAEFERISAQCGGCLEVFYDRTTVSGGRIPEETEVVNVVAIQRGSTDPNRHILMGGHLDSRVSSVMNDTARAPGANDDGSGVVAAIETARVLSQYRFNASLVYVAFTGEEQGLFGSTHLAERAKAEGWDLEAVLNNDLVGNIHGVDGVIDNTTIRVFSEGTRADETERMAGMRRFTGGENDSPSRNLARYIDRIADEYVRNLDVMMIYRLDRFGRGGDHRPFNDEGFPAVRFAEPHENYVQQHQDLRVEDGIEYGDVIDGVEYPYMAKVAGLNAAAMASLAWAPPPPRGVEIEGAVRPSTTLSWDAVDGNRAPDLAGYKVYWRLTDSPVWQWSEYVGDTTEHTLENVVIDNYIFGVASVSEGGFESPVVFPGPIGEFAPASTGTQTATGQEP